MKIPKTLFSNLHGRILTIDDETAFKGAITSDNDKSRDIFIEHYC